MRSYILLHFSLPVGIISIFEIHLLIEWICLNFLKNLNWFDISFRCVNLFLIVCFLESWVYSSLDFEFLLISINFCLNLVFLIKGFVFFKNSFIYFWISNLLFFTYYLFMKKKLAVHSIQHHLYINLNYNYYLFINF